MSFKRIITVLFLILISGAGVFSFCPKSAADEIQRTKIIFLHTNDLHFDFNHLESFKQVVDYFREKYDNVFLLDAGDFLVRHQHRWPVDDLEFYRQRSRFMIETMNAMKYDLVVLGNHELDYKGTVTRDSLRKARFPILGANVEVTTDKYDQPEPYVVLETGDGLTIAVLGLSTGGASGIRTGDREQTVRDHLYLREEHDLLVLLTHIGYRADQALANLFGEVDLIIGGHSHTQLNPAEMVNGVLIAQTGGHPHVIDQNRRQHLGVVRVIMEAGEVVSKTGEVLSIDADYEVELPVTVPAEPENSLEPLITD